MARRAMQRQSVKPRRAATLSSQQMQVLQMQMQILVEAAKLAPSFWFIPFLLLLLLLVLVLVFLSAHYQIS